MEIINSNNLQNRNFIEVFGTPRKLFNYKQKDSFYFAFT